MAGQPYPLLCLGHPLLDMQVTNGEMLLRKYELKANDAILAEERHAPLYEEIVSDYPVTLVAGGAAQSTARGAAYCLPPRSVVFTGCVGDDAFSEHLRAVNAREGVKTAYQVKPGAKTGVCAVVITGVDRSLVTTLRAAELLERSHLLTPDVAALIEGAKVYYVEGYVLRHALDSVLEIAKHASDTGKTFVLNLSAPYIAQFFHSQVETALPFCDVVIGNEAEAAAWATASGQPSATDLPAIARAIAVLPKANEARQRIVILTHGAKSTTVVSAAEPDTPRVYPVDARPAAQIVDTNGAGDAFAGGLLAGLVSGRSLDECIAAGHKLAAMNVQQVGPQYVWPKIDIL